MRAPIPIAVMTFNQMRRRRVDMASPHGPPGTSRRRPPSSDRRGKRSASQSVYQSLLNARGYPSLNKAPTLRAMKGTPEAPRTRARATGAGIHGGLGDRIRHYRKQAGLTQRQLAGDRYTGAYVSALENGLVRASMAALTYLAQRLDVTVEQLLTDQVPRWDRLEADIQLASGDWHRAVDRYTALIEQTASPTEQAQLLRGRAEAYCRLGRPRDAIADATVAQQELKRTGHHADAAYAAYWLANAHYQLDNPAEARAIGHQVLAEVRAGLSVQSDFLWRLLVALAAVESWEGHHDRALTLLEEARALNQELDDRSRATILFSLAIGYAETGDHEAALRAGSQGLGLFEVTDARAEAASLRNSLALAYLHGGNLSRASELVAEARDAVSQLGDRRLLAHVAETQAQIALAADDEAMVIRQVDEALELARSTHNTHAESSALLTLARLHHRHRRVAEAETAYRQAADILRAAGPRPRLSEVLRDWADLLASEGRHPEAVPLLQEALAR